MVRTNFLYGLSENNLKETYKGLLSPQEIFKILTDLGFDLENPEQSGKEFDLRWGLGAGKSVLSFSETDFSGAEESPCQEWIRFSKFNELLHE